MPMPYIKRINTKLLEYEMLLKFFRGKTFICLSTSSVGHHMALILVTWALAIRVVVCGKDQKGLSPPHTSKAVRKTRLLQRRKHSQRYLKQFPKTFSGMVCGLGKQQSAHETFQNCQIDAMMKRFWIFQSDHWSIPRSQNYKSLLCSWQ